MHHAEHDFVDGTCRYCGAIQHTNAQEQRTCLSRRETADATPRATPSSIFSNLGDIGDLAKAIRDAEFSNIQNQKIDE